MKFKPYEEYKESEIDYIGKYPIHWDITKLRFIFEERKEKNYGKREKNILSVVKNIGVIPYSEKGNVGNKHSEDIERYKLVYKNDIVMNSMNVIIGSVGRSQYEGVLSPIYYVLKIRDKEKFNVIYYENIFRMTSLQRELTKYGKGILAHRMRIPMELLKNLELPLPPKEEQDKIAAFLDHNLAKIDKFVELTERQIELLKEQKEVIINDAVTKGIDNDVAYKDSGIDWIGKIPEHWEVTRLKYLTNSNLTSLSNNEEKDKEIEYIDIGSVGFFKLKSEPVKMLFGQAPSRARRVVRKGDIIISTVRTYLKSMLYIDESLSGKIVSTGFSVLTPKGGVNSNYLKYSISGNYLIQNIIKSSVGVAYPAINDDRLMSLKIVYCRDKKEQEEIINYIEKETNKIDRTIELHKRQIELIKEYRTSLIASAVTGKIDVRDF